MEKTTYLKYLRNTQSTRKPTVQSLNKNQIQIDQINTETTNLQEMCNDGPEQVEIMESQSHKKFQKDTETVNMRKIDFQNKKTRMSDIKNIRVHNKTAEGIRKKNQTEEIYEAKKDLNPNQRNSSSQLQLDSGISQGVHSSKLVTQSLHNPNPPKQREMVIQLLRNLESPSFYNPSLSQQKIFYQPIKPYDRNKTARNKKFKSLKTAFSELNSSCRNYNDEYMMSLQNLRMGWRIVNTKSMIEEYLNSTYFTYHLYNGSVINKQKNKELFSKEKKKINLKQMKNIYKVFFNKNIFFNTKHSKNTKILQSIKKKDEVNDFVLNQSFNKSMSKDNSLTTPNEKFRDQSPENLFKEQNERSLKSRGSHKIRPCFFRNTQKHNYNKSNTRICEKVKYEKLSQSLYYRQGNFIGKNKIEIEPNRVQPKEENLQLNEIFGKGATIIQIRNLTIQAGTVIKKEDLLVLELMVKNGHITSKGILTPPIKYSEIKGGIKFALDTKVGDFVPLKIWKYHGINLIELGIIDLNLLVFRNRKTYFKFQNGFQSETYSDGIHEIQLYKQQRQNFSQNQIQERDILFNHTKEKLRKNKKAQIQITVSFNCLIYNKKYVKQKTKINDSDKENMTLQDSIMFE